MDANSSLDLLGFTIDFNTVVFSQAANAFTTILAFAILPERQSSSASMATNLARCLGSGRSPRSSRIREHLMD
jgi:hypothetical protein